MTESNREELGALLRRIEEVRGLAPGAVAHETAALDDPAAIVPVVSQLVDDLERSHRRLIEANVQLVSLREVASSLTTTRDAGEATRLVARYLRGALGFEQVGLLLVDAERGVLTGTWAWSGGLTPVEVALSRAAGAIPAALAGEPSPGAAPQRALVLPREHPLAPGLARPARVGGLHARADARERAARARARAQPRLPRRRPRLDAGRAGRVRDRWPGAEHEPHRAGAARVRRGLGRGPRSRQPVRRRGRGADHPDARHRTAR